MITTSMICLAIAVFLSGVAFMMIFFRGRKNDKTIPSGELVIDMTEGVPNLYLSISSEDVLLDIVKNNRKEVKLNVLIRR